VDTAVVPTAEIIKEAVVVLTEETRSDRLAAIRVAVPTVQNRAEAVPVTRADTAKTEVIRDRAIRPRHAIPDRQMFVSTDKNEVALRIVASRTAATIPIGADIQETADSAVDRAQRT